MTVKLTLCVHAFFKQLSLQLREIKFVTEAKEALRREAKKTM